MNCPTSDKDLPQCEYVDEISKMLNKLWYSGKKGQIKCSKIRMRLIKENDIVYNYDPYGGWYYFD